jgi:hypothetical protein
MGKIIKLVALSIALTVFVLMSLYGFAIWVFIPLLPAGLIFGAAVYLERQQAHKSEPSSKSGPDHRKAA